MILENSTLIYALPALAFVGAAVLWWITSRLESEGVSRFLGMLPVWSCYAAFGALLFAGGLHRIAHVRLEGVEMDFAVSGGKGRALPIGGWDEEGEDPAIYVRGYPADALRMITENGKLRLIPGRGYRRDLLVRSQGTLIPLEAGGVPALVPLQDGDEIVLGAGAGGGDRVAWVLGAGAYDLTPPTSRVRWLGGTGTGVARAVGYPAEVIGVQRVGNGLKVVRGSGYAKGMRVLVDGQDLGLGQTAERLVKYRAGQTRLELVKADPLAGVVRVSGGKLAWKGQTEAVPLVLTSEGVKTAGGNPFDDLYVKGLPGGALTLTASASGLVMENVTGVAGLPERWEGAPGKALVFGGGGQTAGGRLMVKEVKSLGVPGQEVVEESTGAAPVAAAEQFSVHCFWKPAEETAFEIPKRKASLPVVGTEVELLTYLKWGDRVYPLAKLSSRESAVRSCVVFGAPGLKMNQAGLLIMEPGVVVKRGGKAVAIPGAGSPGVIPDGAELEFLQVRSLRQSGPRGAARSVLQPSEVVEMLWVTERKRLAKVSAGTSPIRKVPSVKIRLSKPEIEAVDIEKIKEDVKENEALDGRVAFGLNDQTEWASLPHQVKFDSITKWFRGASGEVELHWLDLMVHDDYRRKKMEFGEAFVVGGSDRLQVRVIKQTVPWGILRWLLAALVLGTIAAWPWTKRFWGSALFFGVAYLAGSRMLFGQAAAVNYPYDESIVGMAVKVLCFLPLLLSAILFLGSRVFQGMPGRVLGWLAGRGYVFYAGCALVLMLLRFGLLFAGFKEGISLFGPRLALSMFFVPLYLLLFGIGIAKVLVDLKDGWPVRKLWQFVLFAGWVMFCQGISGLAVSDLGTFLYAVPPAMVLGLIGVWVVLKGLDEGSEVMESGKSMVSWFGAAVALVVPLVGIVLVLAFPKALVKLAAPSLEAQVVEQGEIVTDSTLLRILHFADESFLINLGTDAAEAILQDHAIMENYSRRGMRGQGYLQVDIIPTKKVTAMNDNVSAVFIFGQFGVLGAAAICVAYLAVGMGTLGAGSGAADWVARLAALVFTLTSLYMLAANWGLTPFTGRNMYLLGLNSLGDIAEGALLLCLVAVGRSLGDVAMKKEGVTE